MNSQSQFALTPPPRPLPPRVSVCLAVGLWSSWVVVCTLAITGLVWLTLEEQKPKVLAVTGAGVLLAVLNTLWFARQPLCRLRQLLRDYTHESDLDLAKLDKLDRTDMIYEQVALLLQQLSWERQRSQAILGAAGPILTCALDGTINSANRSVERLFGYRHRDLIGRHISCLVPEWDQHFERMPLDSSSDFLRLGGPQLEGRHANGKAIPIEVQVKLVFLPSGSLLVVTVSDVSMTRRLSELQRLHSLTFAGVSDAIVITDQAGQIIGWNPAAVQMFGYTEAEVLGKPVTLLHNAEAPPEIAPQLMERLQREGRWNIEFRYKRKDGTEGICETVIAPLLDEQGQRVAVLRVHRDITQRKRAEEQIRLLQSVVAQASDAVLITDVQTIDEPGPRILYVNDAFCRMTGYSPSEVIGRSPRFLQGPKTDPAARKAIRQALAQWQPVKVELVNYRKDGTPFWAELNIAPVTHTSGFITHWVAIQRDVTERKRAEEQLLIAKEAAEAANRSKSDFIASVSHEIRTPMNGILGLTQLLQQAPLDATCREYVNLISLSARTLRSLIDDLLDFSKAEAGKMRLDARRFSLRKCLAEAIEPLFTNTNKPHLRTRYAVAPDVPDQLIGDPDRLRQVLVNLVGNAIKFTERGFVAVDCRQESATDETVTLYFTVEDTGIGIAAEHLESIFKPFEQATPTTTRRFGGTGLGLAICERLVHLMDGRIGVTSQLGKGSTFWFSVVLRRPRSATALPNGASVPAHALLQRHAAIPAATRFRGEVLIVEDSSINQLVLSRMLMLYGLDPVVVGHGVEAINRIEQQRFDLILMDVQMPDLDGYEVTARIRQYERQVGLARQPIVAITAYARQEDRQACLQAGMDDHLTKPIDQERLLTVLQRWLRPQPDSEDSLAQPAESAASADHSAGPDPLSPRLAAVFRPEDALGRLGGDVELLREIVQIYLRDAPACLGDLTRAVSQRDADQTRRHAHRFKGLAGYMAPSLHQLAEQLQSWPPSDDWTEPDEWFKQLDAQAQRLADEAQDWLAATSPTC